MSGADRLVELAQATTTMTAQARAVYEAGFPPAVRAPFADLMDARPDERMQLLVDAGATVLGVTVVRDFPVELRTTFLRYFVVAADQRGQGIGGRLWAALGADLSGRDCHRLLFDVEDPDDPEADATEAVERRRRVSFYRRLGAEMVDVERYAPPHHGQPGTPEMPLRLMAADLDASGHSTPPALDAANAVALVATVMRHRYGSVG